MNSPFVRRCAWITVVLAGIATSANSQSLRVVTFNCWTGLDYIGRSAMGEYETQARRDERRALLVHELRTARADVIALQEVNPAGMVAHAIADTLGYDCVAVRTNAGIKVGSLGAPSNLNEGLAFLARKQLRLRFVDVWEASEGFGLFGDVVSFHLTERNAVLAARISVNGRDLFILNTHLTAVVPREASTDSMLEVIIAHEGCTGEQARDLRSSAALLAEVRLRQVQRIRDLADRKLGDVPAIVMGDFNVAPNSPDLAPLLCDGRFFDAGACSEKANQITWDPDRNRNVRFSTDSVDARGRPLPPLAILGAWHDLEPRRIDYVFPAAPFRSGDILGGTLIGDTSENGLFASDHYGVQIDLNIPWTIDSTAAGIPLRESETEFFPILSYDTDVGFGYGGKAFVLNSLGWNESFDVVAFNSSKGERWYRMVFSWPDFELRQGRVYPFALDVTVDYDKYIRNNFFGIGNASQYKYRELYSREPLELNAALNRGWTETSVSQVSVKYKAVRNFNFDSTSALAVLPPAVNAGIARTISLTLAHRYDTRDSYINPSRGIVLQGEVERAFGASFTNVSLTRVSGVVQWYATLFYPKTVFALRGSIAAEEGSGLPVQSLLSVGGTNTLRGSPQDRYLDRTVAVLNAELRIQLFWRFGAVLGMDAGRVWRRPSEASFAAWSSNPVVGLRFYMDTFVVRADLGFGAETTGFYLNFGQLF